MRTIWIIERGVEFSAGEDAPPGHYCRADGHGRHVFLHHGGPLPASCDGRRAAYVPARPTHLPTVERATAGRHAVGA